FQAEDGIRDATVTGVQTCALPIWLQQTTGASPSEIAVAIETPRGPLVELLLERDFQVFALNPKQLDRFRDRFTVAGAKDDSRDRSEERRVGKEVKGRWCTRC